MLFSQVLAIVFCLNHALVWQPFKPSDGSFTVMMPGEVKEKKVTAQTAVGPLESKMYYSETKDSSESNFIFGINYCDYPVYLADSADLSEELLTSTVEEYALQVNGRVVYSSPDHTYGTQGRVWRIHYNQDHNVLKGRAFVYKNRYYALLAYAKNDPTKDHSDRFFNSFVLNKS